MKRLAVPFKSFVGFRAKLYPIKVHMEVKTKSGAIKHINQKSATAGTKAPQIIDEYN